MTLVETEQVLVVPTSLFHDIGHFQGFCPDVEKYFEHLVNPEHASYRPRGEMERDPSFKQLIPYVIFRYTDDAGRVHVFQYTRGKGQGEGRLHSKRSIGIGGHISSVDAENDGAFDPYAEGMRRELEEEVAINTPYRDACVGLINDDETEVGRVHLGVVHIFDVSEPSILPREDDIAEAGFVPVSDLIADMSRFETWSQICLRALFAV
jgi:predicted NUDIX family phosphoesterase